MSIKENTELIAEFMGIVYNKDEDRYYNNGYKIQSTLLNFYRSWDWLMPVVEKIESLGYEFFIVEDRVKVSHNTDHSIETIIDLTFGGSKRDATYQGVVEFINQYNKNQ